MKGLISLNKSPRKSPSRFCSDGSKPGNLGASICPDLSTFVLSTFVLSTLALSDARGSFPVAGGSIIVCCVGCAGCACVCVCGLAVPSGRNRSGLGGTMDLDSFSWGGGAAAGFPVLTKTRSSGRPVIELVFPVDVTVRNVNQCSPSASARNANLPDSTGCRATIFQFLPRSWETSNSTSRISCADPPISKGIVKFGTLTGIIGGMESCPKLDGERATTNVQKTHEATDRGEIARFMAGEKCGGDVVMHVFARIGRFL